MKNFREVNDDILKEMKNDIDSLSKSQSTKK